MADASLRLDRNAKTEKHSLKTPFLRISVLSYSLRNEVKTAPEETAVGQ